MTRPDVRPLGSALEFVRGHPEMFLLPGELSLEYKIAFQLLFDATVLGASPVSVSSWNNWMLVGSQRDWLTSAGKSDGETFSTVIAFPEAGQNSVRHEIVAAAFASEVAVLRPAGISIIKGPAGSFSEVKRHADEALAGQTVVAFRCNSPR